MRNYICPKCGNHIQFWEEKLYTRIKRIDIANGNVYKNSTYSIEAEDYNGMKGLKCKDERCDWFVNINYPTNETESNLVDRFCSKNKKL